MEKLIAILAAAAVLLPLFQPVAEQLGPKAATLVQVAGVFAAAGTKGLVDVRGRLARRKERRARRRAAQR